MALWTNFGRWEDAASGRTCPICLAGGPTHVIAEVEGSWLTMDCDAAPALPGTCALFFRRHVVELHELDRAEAQQFIAAVKQVSRILSEETGAVKINLEVHGNTIPHLHAHFYPRYPADPFETGPIDPRLHGRSKDLRRHIEIRDRVAARLQAPPQTH